MSTASDCSLGASGAFSHLSKLCPNTTRLDCHHDRLHGADLLIADAFFPGHAKIVLHSWIARGRHRGCKVNHQCGLLIQDVVIPGGLVELTKRLVLFFGKHRALLSSFVRCCPTRGFSVVQSGSCLVGGEICGLELDYFEASSTAATPRASASR